MVGDTTSLEHASAQQRALEDDALPVGEVARMAGVTVRTLHHYDEIGLVRPGRRTRSGYRLYDEADLVRLQSVLAYRELGFGLDEIKELLDGDLSVDDELEHLRRQHRLLTGRIARLQRVLASLERTMEAQTMGIRLTPAERLEVFGEHDPDAYADEARERWGQTDSYRQSQERAARYGKDDWLAIKREGQEVEGGLARLLAEGVPADDPRAMDLAEAHRRHIDRWFYDTSYEMHTGLADMYIADPRFTKHYEDVAPGLAQYVHDAIHANAVRSV
jgi:DNA-binding transcriptional MerR regulator